MKKVLFVLLLVAVLIGSFVSCKEEPAPAHEHTWDEGSVTTPATCENAGVKTYKCECGETKTESIPALGHNWDAGVVSTPATCGAAGVKTFTCQNNPVHTKTESIPATGLHTWGEWENTTPATVLAEGVDTRTCSVCEQSETRPVAKLALEVATFADFKAAFSYERQEGDTYTIKLTADVAWEGDAFEPTATGITIDLGGHTISDVPKNYFNLKGDSFTLKNGTITGSSSNDRYSVNINYNGNNATTPELKAKALAATPAAYDEEDAVWAKRIKVENITATGMLCGYSTMEIKNCTFSAGKYRGLVMQGSSGIVENITVNAPSASSAGFVAHSYGTVLVKGTNSFLGKFGVYSALCPTLIIDSSAVVTATGASTYAFYLETQGNITINAGAEITLVPAGENAAFYMRTGSTVDIAAGAIIKDSTGTAFAKPIPVAAINSSGNGASDSEWRGYGVAPAITDNRE